MADESQLMRAPAITALRDTRQRTTRTRMHVRFRSCLPAAGRAFVTNTTANYGKTSVIGSL